MEAKQKNEKETKKDRKKESKRRQENIMNWKQKTGTSKQRKEQTKEQ